MEKFGTILMIVGFGVMSLCLVERVETIVKNIKSKRKQKKESEDL